MNLWTCLPLALAACGAGGELPEPVPFTPAAVDGVYAVTFDCDPGQPPCQAGRFIAIRKPDPVGVCSEGKIAVKLMGHAYPAPELGMFGLACADPGGAAVGTIETIDKLCDFDSAASEWCGWRIAPARLIHTADGSFVADVTIADVHGPVTSARMTLTR